MHTVKNVLTMFDNKYRHISKDLEDYKVFSIKIKAARLSCLMYTNV